AGTAYRENRGLGVVVWGEAGVGKSHLLARLALWCRRHHHHAFVYLHNLQASPERLPRYVLKCVVSLLVRGLASPLHETPLSFLGNDGVRAALQAAGATRPTWPAVTAAYQRWLDRLAVAGTAQGGLFDRSIYEVLFRYYQAAHPMQKGQSEAVAHAALRW